MHLSKPHQILILTILAMNPPCRGYFKITSKKLRTAKDAIVLGNVALGRYLHALGAALSDSFSLKSIVWLAKNAMNSHQSCAELYADIFTRLEIRDISCFWKCACDAVEEVACKKYIEKCHNGDIRCAYFSATPDSTNVDNPSVDLLGVNRASTRPGGGASNRSRKDGAHAPR